MHVAGTDVVLPDATRFPLGSSGGARKARSATEGTDDALELVISAVYRDCGQGLTIAGGS